MGNFAPNRRHSGELQGLYGAFSRIYDPLFGSAVRVSSPKGNPLYGTPMPASTMLLAFVGFRISSTGIRTIPLSFLCFPDSAHAILMQ